MKLGATVTRDRLKLTLGRAAAELRSKGTIEEPVAKRVGWGTQKLDAFYSQISDAPQETIADLRTAAQGKAKSSSDLASGWLKGTMGAWAIGAAFMVAAPVMGPALGVATAALTIGAGVVTAGKTIAHSLESQEAKKTDAALETWGNAYREADAFIA